MSNTPPFIRMGAVLSLTEVSRPTLMRQIRSGLFPQQIKLGDRTVVWPTTEVISVIAARVEGKSDDDVKLLVSALQDSRPTSLKSAIYSSLEKM